MSKLFCFSIVILCSTAMCVHRSCTAYPASLEIFSNDCPPFFTDEFDAWYQVHPPQDQTTRPTVTTSIDLSQSTTDTHTMMEELP